MGKGVVIGEDAVMVMGPGNGCRRHWEQKGRAMMGDPWRGVPQGPGAYYNEKTGGIRHTEVAVSLSTLCGVTGAAERGLGNLGVKPELTGGRQLGAWSQEPLPAGE